MNNKSEFLHFAIKTAKNAGKIQMQYFGNISSQLTIPQNLVDLVNQNQTGLVMLKIIEIIGEDDIHDLDPETIYFLNRILNKLNLKKIRNHILSEALPVRV